MLFFGLQNLVLICFKIKLKEKGKLITFRQ